MLASLTGSLYQSKPEADGGIHLNTIGYEDEIPDIGNGEAPLIVLALRVRLGIINRQEFVGLN